MIEAAKPFFAFEKEMDVFMEKYYKSKGCTIYKNGDKQKDITLSYNGTETSVEHKYRKVIYKDILVEIIQDMESNNTGWFYECEADLLHYIICQPFEETMQPIYFHKIEFGSFKNWFLKRFITDQHPDVRICTEGYGITLNMPVALNIIPDNIIKKDIMIKEKQC